MRRMTSARPAAATASSRRWYLTATLACTAIAIYGSLVPFNYQPKAWYDAIAAFSQIPYIQLGIESRADFVANILLFVPLGFLLMGVLRVDRTGAVGTAVAAVAVTLTGGALSLGIEFTQVFFPPRTVSINDIVAETIGAGLGVGIWMILGTAFTEWVRRFLACRDRAGLTVHLLTLYVVLFAVSEMLPLDLTISLPDFVDKYRQGRVLLVPFSHIYESPTLAIWELAADVLLHIPLGALALVGWARSGAWRRTSDAFALGCAFVILVEVAQLFVFSRFTDVTDLLVGAAGVALGIALTRIVAARPTLASDRSSEATIRFWPWLAAVAWLGVLVAYHWYPFDFVLSRTQLLDRWAQMFAAPFSHYYWGSEFQAFTQISRKFLMALPLGVLMRVAVPGNPRVAMARLQLAAVLSAAFLALCGIEVGQLLLPQRIADITDVFIGEAGVVVGLIVCGALSLRQDGRQVESLSW